ncbi:MAG: hypothetical protein NZ534_05290, partial [Bacteroidia bacterium]|nr:hypothetical protein [Bacteroidia bacterium]
MKHIIASLFLCTGWIVMVNQVFGQCTPDTSACTPTSIERPICGSPPQLPPGCVGQPYNASSIINILRGTVLNGFNITISRLEIIAVNNLPP